jgi:outer membrane protein OmpA-like peptidoglycan-associated protein
LCPLEAPRAVVVDKEALMARLSNSGSNTSRYRDVGENRVAVSLNVQFAINSSIITSDFDEEIGRAAAFLRANPGVVAIVEGHTDITGTPEYNQWLSDRRANAVRKMLIDKHGVREAQISAVGFGQDRPIADNGTAEGRAVNRRVDLVLDSSEDKQGGVLQTQFGLEQAAANDLALRSPNPTNPSGDAEAAKEPLRDRLSKSGSSASRYRDVSENRVAMSLNVQFANNSSIITRDFDEEISKAASFLRNNPEVVAVVEGHSDSTGTPEYNQWLSDRRANSVRKMLIEKHGVRESQITAGGFGQDRPIADNNTEEGRTLNRRVDLVLDSSGV